MLKRLFFCALTFIQWLLFLPALYLVSRFSDSFEWHMIEGKETQILMMPADSEAPFIFVVVVLLMIFLTAILLYMAPKSFSEKRNTLSKYSFGFLILFPLAFSLVAMVMSV